MKTKLKQTEKSAIEQLREIRDKISAETQDMTFEKLQKYIEERLTDALHSNAKWDRLSGVTL